MEPRSTSTFPTSARIGWWLLLPHLIPCLCYVFLRPLFTSISVINNNSQSDFSKNPSAHAGTKRASREVCGVGKLGMKGGSVALLWPTRGPILKDDPGQSPQHHTGGPFSNFLHFQTQHTRQLERFLVQSKCLVGAAGSESLLNRQG